VIIRQYFGVDVDTIRYVITRQLPELKKTVCSDEKM